MYERLLVIAPHMDDEALSCGGLILTRLQYSKATVKVLTLSGRVYDYGRESEEDSFTREYADYQKALEILGVDNFETLNLKEGEPAEVGFYSVLESIEKNLKTFNPTEVVIPSASDLNQDHRHYNHVCRIALRPANLGAVSRIMESYSFDSEGGDHNYFISMNRKMLDTKLKAIWQYERERRGGHHPRAVQNMKAHHRVMGARVGVEFAEAYSLIMNKEF